jgi:hypothetical protein
MAELTSRIDIFTLKSYHFGGDGVAKNAFDTTTSLIA